MTLTDFLTARLDEQRTECDGTGEYSGCWKLSEFVERSVEAMRRIVEDSMEFEDVYEGSGLRIALRHLATVYADHRDYREEWRV